MKIKTEIQKSENKFFNLCHKHQVKTLYAFGSSVTDQFDEKNSDIDLLVDIDETDPIERGRILMDFWDHMENFFGRKVDLLTESSLKNPILRRSIEKKKIMIYDRRGQKVPS